MAVSTALVVWFHQLRSFTVFIHFPSFPLRHPQTSIAMFEARTSANRGDSVIFLILAATLDAEVH